MDICKRILVLESRRRSGIIDEKGQGKKNYDYNDDLQEFYYDRKRLAELAAYYVYYKGYKMEAAAEKAREILRKEKRGNNG